MSQDLRGLPLPLRFAFVASVAAGAIGAIGGLVLGLTAYVPTAPFAVVEGGLLAGVAGFVAGLTVGVLTTMMVNVAVHQTTPRVFCLDREHPLAVLPDRRPLGPAAPPTETPSPSQEQNIGVLTGQRSTFVLCGSDDGRRCRALL